MIALGYFKNESVAIINFNNCIFNESFELSNFVNLYEELKYNVEILNVTIIKSGIFTPVSSPNDGHNVIVDLKMRSIKCYEGLSINSYIKNESLEFFTYILFNSECEGILKFGNIKFNNLTFTGANLKLLTSFDQCDFNEVCFKDFDNNSGIKFTNTENIHHLKIENSDLNNVVFRPLKVSSIKLYPDSFLGGMKIYGSDAISLETTELSPDQKQEFYRQLKQSAKNSNNKFLELEYKAKEMQHYKPSGKAEWFSHWINSLSNHGTDWGKPLIYIIYWNIVIWLLISYNLYIDQMVILLHTGHSMSQILFKLSFGFWIILNPVSRMSEFTAYMEYKLPVHNIVPFLFFSAKIINGILIYQMIAAFRKWVGKE